MPVTASARQTPPGARPDRRMGPGNRPRCLSASDSRVGRVRRPATDVPEEWPSKGGNALDRTRLTGRLARINVLIGFVLQRDDRRPGRAPDFIPVLDLFTGKLCPKSRSLADP